MRPQLEEANLAADAGVSLSAALLTALDTLDRQSRSEVISRAAKTVDPDALVEAVGDHENSIHRNAAMQALAEGGVRSVPALIRALRHPDSDVVLFAVNVLGRTRDRSAIAHIIPLLDDDNLNVAQAAIETLANLRASVAVDALVRTLQRDPWLQLAAVHALGEIGDTRSVQALAQFLSEEGLREVVVGALGRIGSPEALDVLAKLLRETLNSDGFVDCLKALGELLDRQPDEGTLGSVASWVELGSAGAADVQARLAKILAIEVPPGRRAEEELDLKRAAAAIVRALKIRSLYCHLILAGENERLRERLRFCTVAIGSDMGPTIVQALQDPNANVRAFAGECAGTLALHGAAPRLLTLLADEAPSVRASAVGALSRLQYLSAIPALVRLLDDLSPTVADAAEDALGRFPPEIVARSVPWDMSTGDRLVRALAIAAKCPHPTQLPLLLASLENERADVRQVAVTALCAHRLPEFASLIEPMLSDPSALVRVATYEALGRSRTERARRLLLDRLVANVDADQRIHIVAALAEHEDSTLVPELLAAMHHAQGNLRIAIARALVRLDRAAAEPILVRFLGDPDAKLRAAIVRTLAELPSPTILSYLVSAERDTDAEVRAAVAESLPIRRGGLESHDSTHLALERLSVDSDPAVARVAKERLERLAAPRPSGPDNDTVRPVPLPSLFSVAVAHSDPSQRP